MKFLNFLKNIFVFLKDDLISIFTTKEDMRFLKLFLYLIFFIFLIKLLMLVLGLNKNFITI